VKPMIAARDALGLCAALAVLSCGDSGGTRYEIPATAYGTQARAVEIDGAILRLTRAEIAFGPLYLCATESAESELCGTALAELLSTRLVDGLAKDAQRLGTIEATSGTIRSGFFDYGITWGLTQQAPRPNPGAMQHSARLEGEIELDDGSSYTFHAEVDINPLSPGDAAVNGLKTRHELSRNTQSLSVTFDPSAWLTRVKLEKLLEIEDDDGEIELTIGTQPYEAILQGMTVNNPPVLRWE